MSASEPDQDGNFSAIYTITVRNVGGTTGTYDLMDNPLPDVNVTVNGAQVTGQITNSFVGPGAYGIVNGMMIGAGDTHVYTITVSLTLGSAILNGLENVTACEEGETGFVANYGLFNRATLTYGTNETTIIDEDCGEIPPFLLLDKTFVSASEPDQNGEFTASYTIVVRNVGGTAGVYDLDDTPAPDTNIVVNGISVSGHIVTNLSGAGPFVLAAGESIDAGDNHSYTLVVSLTLNADVLNGLVSVGACVRDQEGYLANNGLFNEVTLVYGTNDLTLIDEDCGEIPPFLVIDKTFVETSDVDGLGNFVATYILEVANVGGVATFYNLDDEPLFDTNITVIGASVSGHVTDAFVGAGPYNLASLEAIGAGIWHVYTIRVDAVLSPAVMAGSVFVTECGAGQQGNQAGEGLFNEITVVYGSSETTLSTNDCGTIPPIPRYSLVKTRVSPDHPAIIGEEVVFTLTVANTGEVGLGVVPLVDTYNTSLLSFSSAAPAPDSVVPGLLTWTNVGPIDVGQTVVVTARFTAVNYGIGTNRVVGTPFTTNGIPLPPQTSSAPHEATAGSISGTVFNDVNGNGVFDPEDTIGIPNAVITLLNSNSVVIGVVTTGVNGAYSFTNLPPGNYTVLETDPPGYFSTGDIDGGDPNSISVSLNVGQNSTGNDFLDALYASVGDFVWLDLNVNGIQNIGEPGYPNIRLTLFDTNNVVIGVTTSAASGFYSFTNLFPGDYYIRVSIPIGSGLSPQFQGGDPARDSDFNPANARTPIFTLVPGQNNTNVDAGFYEFLIYAQVDQVQGVIEGHQAVLTWDTESEYGTSGWYIERETASDEWERLSDYLPAVGDVLNGGVYAWVDASAQPGATYRYRIIEVEASGTERVSGPYDITYPKATRQAVKSSVAPYRFEPKESEPTVATKSVKTLAPLSVSGESVEAVKVAIRGDGLYRVGADQIADILEVAVEDVINRDVRVQNLGVDVPHRRDQGDVVFFGQAFETLYTDINVYRISLDKGVEIGDLAVSASGASGPSSFTATLVREEQVVVRPDLFNNPTADIWLWQQLITGFRNQFTTTLDLPGFAGGGGTLDVRLKGASAHTHAAEVALNGTVLGVVTLTGTQATKATFDVPPGIWNASGNQIRVTTQPQGGVLYNSFYVDGFTATYAKRYQAESNALIFPADGPVSVQGFSSSDIEVWDVTDGRSPVRLSGVVVQSSGNGWTASFTAPQAGTFVASASHRAPVQVAGWYVNNLKSGMHHVDYLVIHGPGLAEGAQALAANRGAKGLLTKVVPVDAIYDAFNHGIRDGRAIPAFLGYAYRQWMTGPRYVALVGDGSLDYRNYTGAGDSLIPSVPASTPFGVFASDDRLGDITGDGAMELVVGRIPVTTAQQLANYLAKLQAFESGGSWRDRVVIATDDRDGGGAYVEDGTALADRLAGRQISRADIETLGVSGASQALRTALADGAELALYVGHGNLQRMAQEGLLTSADVQAMLNSDRPAVIGALGCLMGSFGMPGSPSLGEQLITASGGAAAVFGSSAMVNNRDGVAFGDAVLAAVYDQGVDRLGDAWATAKNLKAGKWVAGSYQLLGDPALAMGDAYAPRGGPAVYPTRPSYEEWVKWAFPPAWLESGMSTDPNDDPDGDGYTNYEEYLAGTDPLNRDSELVVVTVNSLGEGRTELSWPSVAGRTYVIERATTLGGAYVGIAHAVAATPDTNVWVDEQAPAGSAFYRVRVK
ncbi:MAG TPA: C25 family cysteine peptidase [Kiritimatiellia bacterium]|nr:C25 family cysteine peptidase [Kiritimatiellia bacterium]HMP00618.1 C25 family cysteine peptidase [Kiritimatiellia bacterium]